MKLRQSKYLIAPALLAGAITVAIIARADDDDKKPATTESADKADAPTAGVKTDTLKQGEITQATVAFGSVTAQPGTIAVFSVPYECRVSKILVTAGQPVDKGVDLIDVEPSPAAKLSLQEAQSNLEVAREDLAQTQQRFDMKLATNAEQLQAQQTLKLAQLRLDNLKSQGMDDHKVLRSESAGLIAKIDVQQGQVIAAGNPLVEAVSQDQVEVRLGVEPSILGKLANGQAVRLFPNGATDPLPGKIRLISQRVNPDTRLVDIFVTPEKHDGLLLDSFIRAELVTDTKTALIAPHNAAIPGDDGYTLFTVKDGKAIKHTIKIGLENNQQCEVIADDLHAGDVIVTEGNLELDDQLKVEVEADEDATTKPAAVAASFIIHHSSFIISPKETP